MFPNAPPEALDLLRKLLQFNPNKRISAEVGRTGSSRASLTKPSLFTVQQALAHPYLAQFHIPAEEPACDRPIRLSIDDDTKSASPFARSFAHAGLFQVLGQRVPRTPVQLYPPQARSCSS